MPTPRPGDALTNASSPAVAAERVPGGYVADAGQPPSARSPGGRGTWTSMGTLASDTGKPVGGEEVGIYVNDLVSAATTDRCLRATMTSTNGPLQPVARHYTTSTRPIARTRACRWKVRRAADTTSTYRRSLTPAIAVSGMPLIAFQGDRLDLTGQRHGQGTRRKRGIALTRPGRRRDPGPSGDRRQRRVSFIGDRSTCRPAASRSPSTTNRDDLLAGSVDAGSMLCLAVRSADQPGHRRHRPGRRRDWPIARRRTPVAGWHRIVPRTRRRCRSRR